MDIGNLRKLPYADQAAEIWRGLHSAQKRGIYGGAAILVALLVLYFDLNQLVSLFSGPSFEEIQEKKHDVLVDEMRRQFAKLPIQIDATTVLTRVYVRELKVVFVNEILPSYQLKNIRSVEKATRKIVCTSGMSDYFANGVSFRYEYWNQVKQNASEKDDDDNADTNNAEEHVNRRHLLGSFELRSCSGDDRPNSMDPTVPSFGGPSSN